MLSKRDILILLLYYLGFSKIQHFIFQIRKEAVTIFVTFHDIPNKEADRFRTKMTLLKNRTNVISLDNYMLGKVSYEKVNIVITFDDGYKGWVSNAIPVLNDLGLPATFFISSGSIGLSRERQTEFIKSNFMINQNIDKITGCLSLQDINIIVEDGYSIGGHTTSHCILPEIIDENKLIKEIADDKKNLEAYTGHNVNYFSYPCGLYLNPEFDLISILKRCGYKGAVTLISGFNKLSTNPYLLHREITGAQMSYMLFKARIFGNYNLVNKMKGVLYSVFKQ